VEVHPGDFIFGEEDGVVVVPKDLILPVLHECERIKGLEDQARQDFARGDDPVEVFQHTTSVSRVRAALHFSRED
jgi:4-hydroxy-4-methyl-2-oxoglutarate aldolase